jgi:hypothetical protein
MSANNARRVASSDDLTDDPANPYPLAVKPRDIQPKKLGVNLVEIKNYVDTSPTNTSPTNKPKRTRSTRTTQAITASPTRALQNPPLSYPTRGDRHHLSQEPYHKPIAQPWSKKSACHST